jgi:tRNA-specific 2-thiouridylase
LCNREIKFDVFLKEALKLGADFVATGHYCRKSEQTIDGQTVYQLLAGADKNKDQSYFLCQLTQEQLKYAMFPIGDLQKPEVRRIAEEQKLATAKRKDSQGICFVGKVDLPIFLQQQLAAKQGNIHEILPSWRGYNKPTDGQEQEQKQAQDLEKLSMPYRYTVRDGKKIGTHNGAHFYTIGQRKGLGIGGRKESLFIISTDVKENVIYVGEGDSHPGLYRKALRIQPSEVHWVEPSEAMREGESRDYMVRIRYRQPLQKATLEMRSEGLYIVFDEPQRGIAAGQFAAWYEGENLAGSGVIEA